MSGISALHIECVATLQNKLKQSDLSVRTERASCHEIFRVAAAAAAAAAAGLCEVHTGIFRVL